MQEAVVRLRLAEPSDRDWVFALANDTATRAASFHSQPIEYETHVRWFDATLSGPLRRLFIAESAEGKIGMVRFDFLAGEPGLVEIGLAICAEQRGRGLARPILAEATSAARSLGVTRILARIKASNLPSIKAFESAGYRLLESRTIAGMPGRHYELGLYS